MEVSNSEIQCFKRCKRKWWLTYCRRLQLRRESPLGVRSIGNRVHACLEIGYRENTIPRLVEIHAKLVELDIAEYPEQAEEIRKESDLSAAMVEGYLQWIEETGADEGLTVIAAEEKVSVEVMPGITIKGKLDLKVLRDIDGAKLFLDHKTVADFTTPTRVLHIDEQMLFYELLEYLDLHVKGEDKSKRTDGGIYNMIRRVKRTKAAKPPFFERMEIRHNIHVLEQFFDRVRAEVKEIQRLRWQLDQGDMHAAYPSPTKNCSWDCDFFAVCPLFDDPTTNAEGLVEALYQAGDPYARYETTNESGI